MPWKHWVGLPLLLSLTLWALLAWGLSCTLEWL